MDPSLQAPFTDPGVFVAQSSELQIMDVASTVRRSCVEHKVAFVADTLLKPGIFGRDVFLI